MMSAIPDEAVPSCRDLAVWLLRTATEEDRRLHGELVYRCYVRALMRASEPVRMLRWRRFIRALDEYVCGIPSPNSHAAKHLRSIVAENEDLLAPNYGLSEGDGIVIGSTGDSPALAV
jgi:hypothetical protein